MDNDRHRYKNDDERRLWVLNDEGLYNSWQASRMGMRKYIQQHRKEIDAAISKQLHKKPMS